MTAALRERKEVRSFHRIRRSSSGRILNLVKLSEAAADETRPEVKQLFFSPQLNRSILTKHNVRDNERDLFGRPVHVATKIFIPFDPRRLEIGGRSFFIEEHHFRDHLRDLVHLDISSGEPVVQHDVKVLEALSHSPTLDPFIVTERLRAEGIRVDPSFLAESYAGASKASTDVYKVFTPLLRKALGKVATSEEMNRFVDQVWNTSAATTSNLFLEALQIPRMEWANVIFAWKALIYYDLVSRDTGKKLQHVLKLLHGTTPKLRASGGARVEELKRELARSLYKLHDGSTGYIEVALKRVVRAILNEAGAIDLSRSLRTIAADITGVGMNVVLFDQVTSYFFYLYPRPSHGEVDPDELEGELSNLCNIIALRDDEVSAAAL
jgi:hypothetical protein